MEPCACVRACVSVCMCVCACVFILRSTINWNWFIFLDDNRVNQCSSSINQPVL